MLAAILMFMKSTESCSFYLQIALSRYFVQNELRYLPFRDNQLPIVRKQVCFLVLILSIRHQRGHLHQFRK